MNTENHLQTKQTAAELLASCILDFYSHTIILKTGITDTGFYVDCVLEEAMSMDHLLVLEEKMILKINEKIEIKKLFMTPANAIEFLKHEKCKNKSLEERLRSLDDKVVSLVRINNYFNILSPEVDILERAEGIRYFKLYFFDSIENFCKENEIRIFGALFNNSDDLKNYLKTQRKYQGNNHLSYGADSNLFFSLSGKYSTSYVFDSPGVILTNTILGHIKSLLDEESFIQIKLPEEISDVYDEKRRLEKDGLKILLKNNQTFYGFQHQYLSLPYDDPFFGLFRASKKNIITEYIICEKSFLLDEIISSLNFILKILKIYGFKSYQVFCRNFEKIRRSCAEDFDIEEILKKRFNLSCTVEKNSRSEAVSSIEFFLEDGQLWLHLGPKITVDLFSRDGKELFFLIKRWSLGPIEDFMALLLEKEEGKLPFWLNPVQVKIICLDNCLDYGVKVRDVCLSNNIRAFVDDGKEPLNKRVHLAMKEKASFIVVVGEKEKKANNVALRDEIKNIAEQMGIDSFIKKLQDIGKRKS